MERWDGIGEGKDIKYLHVYVHTYIPTVLFKVEMVKWKLAVSMSQLLRTGALVWLAAAAAYIPI